MNITTSPDFTSVALEDRNHEVAPFVLAFDGVDFWTAVLKAMRKFDENPLPNGSSLEEEPSLAKQKEYLEWQHRQRAMNLLEMKIQEAARQ